MSAPSLKTMRRRLEILAKRQEKLRDDLRDFEGEVAEYASNAGEAAELLREAIDRLSELV